MSLSNPNTPPAESPKRLTSKLDGMNQAEFDSMPLALKARWFGEQAIIGLERARQEALAKKATQKAPDQAA